MEVRHNMLAADDGGKVSIVSTFRAASSVWEHVILEALASSCLQLITS
jgi:hypothetical protein